MWEQVDVVGDKVVYSWILEAPYRLRNKLPGWKWIRGQERGCYVTKDFDLAKRTAESLGQTIKSNGTHDVHKMNMAGHDSGFDLMMKHFKSSEKVED